MYCKACNRAATKKQYRDDPVKRKSATKLWAQQNPDKANAKTRRWQMKNKDYHPKRVATNERAFIANKLAYTKYRAVKRGIAFEITVDDCLAARMRCQDRCPYCGHQIYFRRLKKTDPLYFYGASIDRIFPSKGYTVDNIQFVSNFAQFAKNALTHDEFVRLIRVSAEHLAMTSQGDNRYGRCG